MLCDRRWVTATTMSVILCTGCASKYADFGEPMKLSASEPTPVAHVLANSNQYNGQYVRVSGKVSSVCAKKGCWLRMGGEGADQSVFVKFTCPVEGRLIPMEAVGHDVIVEGTLTVEELSEADARHYAEDAGKSPEEIARIVGPQKQFSMMAPAARVMGMSSQ